MEAKGFVVPPGGGAVWDMEPGRSAALKLLGGQTAESVMLFEETAPTGTATDLHLHHDSDEVAYVMRGEVTCLIGDDITVGHMALLHACTLEDGCFIGMKACIMDGVVVESGAMVAAGALVTPGKRVKRGELWAGSPAKFMRALTEKEMAYFAYSAAHYAELAASYRG